MQLKQVLDRKFPGIQISSSNYPPPAQKVAMANMVSVGMMGTIGMTLAGDKIFSMLGMAPPEFYTSLTSNKFGTCVGAWFIGNTIYQNLISTGAFEVYYNGEAIFSKLETGSLPDVRRIVTDLGAVMDEKGRVGSRRYKPASLDRDPEEEGEEEDPDDAMY
ncbi:hypothetical protein CYMTET_22364 [Cymbomonas tetramitiformis]|uniref:Selenoprotein T n=1 Tax=Cymbomonas tetramitiformis TaxID=36881 RepID=A0AAE0L223_9CHLO|nr:hypothetical protein CYMTET_22364 [Cymbomonas tetramitiformis]